MMNCYQQGKTNISVVYYSFKDAARSYSPLFLFFFFCFFPFFFFFFSFFPFPKTIDFRVDLFSHSAFDPFFLHLWNTKVNHFKFTMQSTSKRSLILIWFKNRTYNPMSLSFTNLPGRVVERWDKNSPTKKNNKPLLKKGDLSATKFADVDNLRKFAPRTPLRI